MKKLLAALVFATAIITPAAAQDVYVDGYFRNDGTYVQPHYRTRPDGNPWNNYSTYGNINPYTGERGYKRPSYNYGNNYGIYSPYGGSSLYGRYNRKRRYGW